MDSEDGVAIEAPGSLNLDTEFLLGQDLEFDQDGKILNLDKFSGVYSRFCWFKISLLFTPVRQQTIEQLNSQDVSAAAFRVSLICSFMLNVS